MSDLLPKLRAGSAATALLGLLLLSGCTGGPEASNNGLTEGVTRKHVDRAEQARLISVTDGDTLAVRLANGSRANVRLLGIDTPETYPHIECGGRQATANMRQLVEPGDILNLHIDLTQHTVDTYGRLLRYVHTGAELDVGLNQVETGHAAVYVYGGIPFATLDTYQAAEDNARSHNRGIWGAC